MFDPPVGGAPLVQAARVTIRHRAGSDAAALLLLAWLGVLLGWRPLRSAQTSDGGVRFDFVRAGQAVAGHLVPADGACGRSGMFSIELTTDAGDRYAIRRTALDQAELHTPGVPAQDGQAGFTIGRRAGGRGARVARARSAVHALPQLRAPALVARDRHRGQPPVARDYETRMT